MHPTIIPTQQKEEDRLMDLEEVAEKLGNISTRSVRRLIARGDLPKPVKVLSSPRLYHSDIVDLPRTPQAEARTDSKTPAR